MEVAKYILGGILIVLACGGVAWFLSVRSMDKNADQQYVLCKVVGWQEGKIPFIGRVALEYTRKGKPIIVGSNLMLRSKRPKDGALGMWTVYTYRVKDKAPVSIAKHKKQANQEKK